jgi:hypothetical protein
MVLGLEPIPPIRGKGLKGPTFDHELAPRKPCDISSLQWLDLKMETFETFGF